jgi:hypothetical protein
LQEPHLAFWPSRDAGRRFELEQDGQGTIIAVPRLVRFRLRQARAEITSERCAGLAAGQGGLKTARHVACISRSIAARRSSLARTRLSNRRDSLTASCPPRRHTPFLRVAPRCG